MVNTEGQATDRYGLVLVVTLLALLASALSAEGSWTQLLALLPQSGALLLALHASGISPRAFRGALVAVLVGVVLAVVLFVASGGASYSTAAYHVLMGALVISALVAIARRLASQPRVTLQTVLGALCVYLFVGMLFGIVYSAIGTFARHPFFASGIQARGVDYLYFSFVTLTTVGYGDLTARGDLARMLAVTEALLGQIYLVTVVAVLVSNIGRHRRRETDAS
jgi:hypothetical protein